MKTKKIDGERIAPNKKITISKTMKTSRYVDSALNTPIQAKIVKTTNEIRKIIISIEPISNRILPTILRSKVVLIKTKKKVNGTTT